MTSIGPKSHLWTYIPELGAYWDYCDRCGKARRCGDKKIVSLKEAMLLKGYKKGVTCGEI